MKSDIVSDNNVRLCYFLAQTKRGIGYICMALERPAKDSTSRTYRAAFAFCSPEEGKQFSKQKARAMALGRLNTYNRLSAENRITFDCTADNINEVFQAGLNIAKESKIAITVDKATGQSIYEDLAPNWVRGKGTKIVFGLNANKLIETLPTK